MSSRWTSCSNNLLRWLLEPLFLHVNPIVCSVGYLQCVDAAIMFGKALLCHESGGC